jgi:para-aminobenzoate synthetase component 1
LKKNPESVFAEIQGIENSIVAQQSIPSIQPRISKKDYLYTINQLRQHILRGDCYEINFCQEFFATDAGIDPIAVYGKLSEISPNPFSCYYKLNDKYLLCASPERYIKKTGSKILSQPIKGTNKRSSTLFEDEQLKQDLISSEKDKSENVMIVDLVRNDLSKICQEGSVQVEELFGIYPFPQVYQMVSTISGQLQDGIDFTDVLTATFPMGSMTGAPKKRVMELIEQYEQTKRGIYSGCVGYISPEKDYDFNVVIRSIMYNYSNKYLSYQVGGGITFYSDAEKEYEECLLKAEAMKKVLQ